MVRFSLPATASEALRKAETVMQAEIQKVKNNAFCMDSEAAEISPASRIRNSDESPDRQVSAVPTKVKAQATRRQILCNVISVKVLDIMRDIVQIGFRGRQTVTREGKMVGKLDNENPVNHPRVIGQKQ